MEDAARRQKILIKAESKLLRLLSEETSSEVLAEAIEKVREATLSLFKGQREIARYQEIDDNPEYKLNVEKHLANLESKMKEWREISHDEVIRRVRGKGI